MSVFAFTLRRNVNANDHRGAILKRKIRSDIMAEIRIVGYDGAITLPTGYYGKINRWAATLSQFIYPTPAFGDVWMSRRGGLQDVAGSAGGLMAYDAAGTNPTGANGLLAKTGGTLVLTAATGCAYTITALMSAVNLLSDLQSTENNLVFNFLGAGTTVTEAWDETP